MNHAENKNIWSKMKEKLHKYSFLGCLLLAGIVFFTWTDNWQVYTEPLQETYTKGVLLAEQLVEGKWPGISGEQSDATGSVSGNVPGENVKTGDTVSDGNQTDQTMGTVQSPATGEEAAMPETTGTETQDPAATVPVEEIPQEVVYHTVDDSYFDDAVFIGDSRTVGMYEYGGLGGDIHVLCFHRTDSLQDVRQCHCIGAWTEEKDHGGGSLVGEAVCQDLSDDRYQRNGYRHSGIFYEGLRGSGTAFAGIAAGCGDLSAGHYESNNGTLRTGGLYHQRRNRSQKCRNRKAGG